MDDRPALPRRTVRLPDGRRLVFYDFPAGGQPEAAPPPAQPAPPLATPPTPSAPRKGP